MAVMLPDGRCSCCGAYSSWTGGCLACNGSFVVCACGILLRYGCGKELAPNHACQSVAVTANVQVPSWP